MPVDASIRNYIDNVLQPIMDDDLFIAQFEIIVLDILRLLTTRPEDARHTAAYLIHRLSLLYMRSRNEALQARRAQGIGTVLRRVYNHRTPIGQIGRVSRADGYPVLVMFYQIHHGLILNGLQAEEGPAQQDAFDALRLLQIIVGAAYGPWHSCIRLQGAIADYHHARVATPEGSPVVEIGRARRRAPFTLHVSTWNLQGSSLGSEAKWRTAVLQLARANHVVVVQEAGAVPPSARLIMRHRVQDQYGHQHEVGQHVWQAGTATRPEWYDVFFLDVQRLRVNLAIVVAQSSGFDLDGVVVVSDGLVGSGGVPDYRPALGVRLVHGTAEPITVYNVHALSGGGANAPRLLREVSWHGGTAFVMLGDFNRDPRPPTEAPSGAGNWVSPPQIARVEPAAGDTHPGTSARAMLDYAVVNGSTEPVAPGEVGVPGPSDHLPVRYAIRFT